MNTSEMQAITKTTGRIIHNENSDGKELSVVNTIDTKCVLICVINHT